MQNQILIKDTQPASETEFLYHVHVWCSKQSVCFSIATTSITATTTGSPFLAITTANHSCCPKQAGCAFTGKKTLWRKSESHIYLFTFHCPLEMKNLLCWTKKYNTSIVFMLYPVQQTRSPLRSSGAICNGPGAYHFIISRICRERFYLVCSHAMVGVVLTSQADICAWGKSWIQSKLVNLGTGFNVCFALCSVIHKECCTSLLLLPEKIKVGVG